MYECELTKVSRPEELEGGLRTKKVKGTSEIVPTVGKCFMMVGPPLDKNLDVRFVQTSVIKDVSKKGKTYTFRTQSGSVYKLKLV
jgi:hypothetical protein